MTAWPTSRTIHVSAHLEVCQTSSVHGTTLCQLTQICSQLEEAKGSFLARRKLIERKEIIFDEGIDLGDFVEGVAGGHLDGKGNGELLTMVVRQF